MGTHVEDIEILGCEIISIIKSVFRVRRLNNMEFIYFCVTFTFLGDTYQVYLITPSAIANDADFKTILSGEAISAGDAFAKCINKEHSDTAQYLGNVPNTYEGLKGLSKLVYYTLHNWQS